MQCKTCGALLTDGARVCTQCGTTQSYEQQEQVPQVDMSQMSKKDFYNLFQNKKYRDDILGCSIFIYICCALNFVLGVLLAGNIFGLLDVLLLLGLGLGIHIAKSRGAAICLCIYSVWNLLITFAETGKPGGYLIIIASVYAITATSRLQKAWKEYQKTGII